MQTRSDIFIIGGGINGTAIAADAASRGLTVTLCEKNDLASATSSASTKLIHGGLRYLESYEFNLVRKALQEREILLKRAPHLVLPLEFILPHEQHLRPQWMIRLGLWIYDHLSRHQNLPNSKVIPLQHDIRGDALLPITKIGFSYYDCHTDDARLVILNALSARENKATILTQTEFLSAEHESKLWKIKTLNKLTSEISYHKAKCLINVSGPWVKQVQKKIATPVQFDIELVKGSHFVVPKLYEGNFAYILQNKDNRIIFAIPYYTHFTLIGTTDIVYHDPLEHITISDEEIQYLCNSINYYFKKAITAKDIVWSYAGVRCLQKTQAKNPSQLTRDYRFILNTDNECPLLTIIGGKLTTHRKLAEEALDQLKPYFKDMGPSSTRSKPLPGGDINDLKAFRNHLKNKYHWLPESLLERYLNYYGTRISLILQDAKQISDLGEDFGQQLYQKEVDYLIKEEWAKTADDILWRRTKLGLSFTKTDRNRLEQYISSK